MSSCEGRHKFFSLIFGIISIGFQLHLDLILTHHQDEGTVPIPVYYMTIITTLKWLISDGDFKEFIPFGNLQGNTYKANQHSGHSTMIITYSRDDLVQIGNIVRHD